MPRYVIFAAAALLSAASSVSASSFLGTTDAIGNTLINTIDATSDAISGNDKVILDARADAASFVGSDGAIRGAYLEAALSHVRAQNPGLEASDMQLAQAILAR